MDEDQPAGAALVLVVGGEEQHRAGGGRVGARPHHDVERVVLGRALVEVADADEPALEVLGQLDERQQGAPGGVLAVLVAGRQVEEHRQRVEDDEAEAGVELAHRLDREPRPRRVEEEEPLAVTAGEVEAGQQHPQGVILGRDEQDVDGDCPRRSPAARPWCSRAATHTSAVDLPSFSRPAAVVSSPAGIISSQIHRCSEVFNPLARTNGDGVGGGGGGLRTFGPSTPAQRAQLVQPVDAGGQVGASSWTTPWWCPGRSRRWSPSSRRACRGGTTSTWPREHARVVGTEVLLEQGDRFAGRARRVQRARQRS